MGVFGFLRNRRRRRLRARPFPFAWAEILARNAPFVARLDAVDRAHLEGDLQVFVAEKTFLGGGGFAITDEHRVTNAAAAARLVLRLDIALYDRLTEIIVYDGAYRAPDDDRVRLGESQHWGVVVVSWSDVLAGQRNQRDGHDVALHELAHVIDRSDGAVDGTPPLRAGAHVRAWAAIMSAHFAKLRAGDRATRKVLDDYGATNEAEFFAVATEAYFERPDRMREQTPDLYELLRSFYG